MSGLEKAVQVSNRLYSGHLYLLMSKHSQATSWKLELQPRHLLLVFRGETYLVLRGKLLCWNWWLLAALYVLVHAVLVLLLLLLLHPGDDGVAVSVAGQVQHNQTHFQAAALLIPMLRLCKSVKEVTSHWFRKYVYWTTTNLSSIFGLF